MKDAWEKWLSLVSGRLGLKMFSLAVAVGLWFFVNVGQKPAERPFKVPLELRNIPPDVMVDNPALSEIEVRVMGPPALLSTIDSDDLKVVLDLDAARPGTSTFRLGADSFDPPRGVRVTRISPSIIHLKVEPVAIRMLPVSVRYEGRIPFGYKLGPVSADPERVRVRGPARLVNGMTSVDTVPIELRSVSEVVTREVRLAAAGRSLQFSPDRVVVSVRLEEERMIREFSRIEVKAKDFGGKYVVSPRRVTLRLSGPKRILDDLQVGPDEVYLDLEGLGPGGHTVALSFGLPPEVQVVRQRPERFKVKISDAAK